VTTDEHAAHVVKGWLWAARTKYELRQLWGDLSEYSKNLDGVMVLNYEIEKGMKK
jgi:hypothetical protein